MRRQRIRILGRVERALWCGEIAEHIVQRVLGDRSIQILAADLLRGADRRRYTINALTRMRYCDRRGRIDLSYSGAPGTQPKGLVPWFDVADRRAAGAHIVFGHWAALGLLRRRDVTALDTGCVWGNHLTAVRLGRPARAVQVSAAAVKRSQRRRRRR